MLGGGDRGVSGNQGDLRGPHLAQEAQSVTCPSGTLRPRPFRGLWRSALWLGSPTEEGQQLGCSPDPACCCYV